MPSTPGAAETESSLVAARHALETLASVRSQRAGDAPLDDRHIQRRTVRPPNRDGQRERDRRHRDRGRQAAAQGTPTGGAASRSPAGQRPPGLRPPARSPGPRRTSRPTRRPSMPAWHVNGFACCVYPSPPQVNPPRGQTHGAIRRRPAAATGTIRRCRGTTEQRPASAPNAATNADSTTASGHSAMPPKVISHRKSSPKYTSPNTHPTPAPLPGPAVRRAEQERIRDTNASGPRSAGGFASQVDPPASAAARGPPAAGPACAQAQSRQYIRLWSASWLRIGLRR